MPGKKRRSIIPRHPKGRRPEQGCARRGSAGARRCAGRRGPLCRGLRTPRRIPARFDNVPEYRAKMAAIALALGELHQAAIHVRAALDRRSSDPEFQLTAAIIYLAAGYFTMAHRARAAWLRTAHPDHPAYAMMLEFEEEYRLGQETLVADYGVSNIKQAENAGNALDEGHWAADEGRWAEAVRHARLAATLAPRWPPPRNHLTLALFMYGRPIEAMREVEFVLSECEADNVHALANGVRLSIALGDRARAEAYGDRLEALPITDQVDSEMKRLEGLGLLDRDAAIDRFGRRLDRAFKDASERAVSLLGDRRRQPGAAPPGALTSGTRAGVGRGQSCRSRDIGRAARGASRGGASPRAIATPTTAIGYLSTHSENSRRSSSASSGMRTVRRAPGRNS